MTKIIEKPDRNAGNAPISPIIGNIVVGLDDMPYGVPTCPSCDEPTYSLPSCHFCGQPFITENQPNFA